MTHPTNTEGAVTDVAAIAKGLTKAQRYWVKEGSAHGDISMRMVRTLISKGLWHIHVDSPNGRYGVAVNTPIGLAVRSHLTEQGVTAS